MGGTAHSLGEFGDRGGTELLVCPGLGRTGAGTFSGTTFITERAGACGDRRRASEFVSRRLISARNNSNRNEQGMKMILYSP